MAVITGLGGMGKTALVAEALGLWESRFEWVLLYQAKPNALGFDATLRDIHMKLKAELAVTTSTCSPAPRTRSTGRPMRRGWGRGLQTSLRKYAIRFRRAEDAGTELHVPRVAELLADPAFRPLDD